MAILDQSVGYGVVLGLGAFFAVAMSLVTMAQKRYHHEFQTSEMFMTAHREVKPGLVAAAVVSSWTWAATLLQSSTVAYSYGVSGPFWYASGATIQVLLFAILAIELKRKAPNAHTMLEIVNVRYGKPAHLVFMFFGLATNIVVTAMLLLGGSAVVSSLTDMNVIAACFLMPLGVIVYTLFGGLKATFLTDYVHSAIIYIIILTFLFTAYGTSEIIGSPRKMYDLLVEAATVKPVVDNAQGSYITMDSLQGLIFGIINIVGNFGTVFVDNAYWQRAIAARPSSTVKAYLVGGLSWFAIPFSLATTMGIAAVALEHAPGSNFTPLTPDQVSSGLVLPTAAAALLGRSGGIAVLILVFMAVTSAASAELIAVSSIFTYDIFRTYIKPGANGKQVVRFSHMAVVSFGLLMGVLAVILNEIHISLGYLYLLMGVISSPAVVPIALALTWRKQSAFAAISGCIIGLIAGVAIWLGVASSLYGPLTIASTGSNYPMLAGNLASLITSGLVTIIISLVKPDNFDFEETKTKLQQLTDDEIEGETTAKRYVDPIEHDEDLLKKATRFAVFSSVGLTVVLVLIWPIPMFCSHYVFSPEFFTFWVAISMIWAICATMAIAVYPLYESREGIVELCSGIVKDLRGMPPSYPEATENEKPVLNVVEKA